MRRSTEAEAKSEKKEKKWKNKTHKKIQGWIQTESNEFVILFLFAF